MRYNNLQVSDYFDGSPDIPDRYPVGPKEGWFQAVWERGNQVNLQ
jgi:hypothetical protein